MYWLNNLLSLKRLKASLNYWINLKKSSHQLVIKTFRNSSNSLTNTTSKMTTLKRKEQRKAAGDVLKPDFKHQDRIHDLSGRQLTFLDMNLVLTAYGSLTIVNLSNNLLVTLPQSFSRCLGHIQILDLSRNLLEVLPDNFHLLKSLHSLILYHNKLRTLPICFWKLEKLGWLDLAANPLDARMQKICGVELTQGATVARNVREFFYLLQNALDSYSHSEQQPEKTFENKILNTSPSNTENSCACHGDQKEIADQDDHRRYAPEAFEKLLKQKPSAGLKLTPNDKEIPDTQSQSSSESGSESRLGQSLALHRQLLHFGGAMCLMVITLSVVSGPPAPLLNGGESRKYQYFPEFLMNTVSWLFYCTLYPLRHLISGVEDVKLLLVEPRSRSFFERIFGY